MIDVPDRSNIHVRLAAVKFLFRHILSLVENRIFVLQEEGEGRGTHILWLSTVKNNMGRPNGVVIKRRAAGSIFGLRAAKQIHASTRGRQDLRKAYRLLNLLEALHDGSG